MADVSKPPHHLDLVIDFVNTLDIEEGTDELATAGDLAQWLRSRNLLDGSAPAGAQDAEQAVRLRESLRGLMRSNNGKAGGREDWAELERTARAGGLGAHFDGDGTFRLAPDTQGVPAGLALLLVPVAHALDDGTWQRVKACRAPDCSWAFYDRSRNRSGVWCEMAVCGNRTKVRAHRARTLGHRH